MRGLFSDQEKCISRGCDDKCQRVRRVISCGPRGVTESAALLADEVWPPKPLTPVLGIVHRTIAAQVLEKLRRTHTCLGFLLQVAPRGPFCCAVSMDLRTFVTTGS